jgi:hypothetical protein
VQQKQEIRVIAGTVPIKTPDGQDELSTRQRRVSQRHRTVLFLVDGKRDATEIRSMALKAGVPDTCFGELVDMGLIMLPEPTYSLSIGKPDFPIEVLHVDLPLPGPDSVSATPDSILPPSRTLYPESVSTDSSLGDSPVPDSWLPSDSNGQDTNFATARLILVRAVRAEAPLAGQLTLIRLRRARNRADLSNLLDEVEARITKPHRSLAASQTMRRVRQLLDGGGDSSRAPG